MLKIILLTFVLLSQSGCAVLLTGYLIGDSIQRNKAIEQCRSSLKATNEQRVKEGKDVFPDQCGT